MSETSDREHTAAAGAPSLRGLLETWSQWSGRDTFEQAARRAEVAGDHVHAARLREFAADEPAVSATEALAAQHEVASLLAGWEWQTMRVAREEGATWAQIARAVDTDPVTARDAYLARVDRQEAAAAEYRWSFGVTAEQAREYRTVAGDWVDQLRPTTPDHVRKEIASAVSRDDTEALANLQQLWWDPEYQSTPTADDDTPVPYQLTDDAHQHLGADRPPIMLARDDGYIDHAVDARDWRPDVGDLPGYAAADVYTTADLTAIAAAMSRGDDVEAERLQARPSGAPVQLSMDTAEAFSSITEPAGDLDPAVSRLECPECGEDAVEQPPATTVPYPAHAIPVPRYAHPDGEPLCPVVGPSGYQPAEPREVLDDETARREQLTRWHSDDQAAAHGTDDGTDAGMQP